MKKNTKIIIILLVVAIGAAVTYYFMFVRPEAELEDVATQNQNSQIGQGLISTLNTLNAVQLDADFFERDDYLILRDNTLSVESRPVGRENPFLPAENVEIDVVRNEEKIKNSIFRADILTDDQTDASNSQDTDSDEFNAEDTSANGA